jgi:DNA-binding transcriptional ArsR family regulator
MPRPLAGGKRACCFELKPRKPIHMTLDIDAIHKALANPVRREILGWLREPYAHFADQDLPLDHGVCAGKIDARCGLSQSTVSAHLAALQRAGLVTSKRVGQWVFFKRNEAVIQAFLEHMNTGL